LGDRKCSRRDFIAAARLSLISSGETRAANITVFDLFDGRETLRLFSSGILICWPGTPPRAIALLAAIAIVDQR
jgi:hypothetical protein